MPQHALDGLLTHNCSRCLRARLRVKKRSPAEIDIPYSKGYNATENIMVAVVSGVVGIETVYHAGNC